MFIYQLANKAVKNLRRFDKITADKIVREIKSLCLLPHPIQYKHVKKLGGYTIRYRLRVGLHYIVVFEIIKTENLIKVIEINTRENIKY